jgi:drug/metabolite transporter (DMT)-like permease
VSGGAARGGAWAGLVALTLIWAFHWLVMKLALRHADPFVFNIHRTLLAIGVLFAVLAWQGRPLLPDSWVAVAVTGFFQVTVNFLGTTMALVEGGAGRTSVLVFTMPFWTLLLARLFLHERMRGAQWLAVALAAAGLLLVIAPWQWEGSLAPKLWAVLSGFGWAASAVATKWFQRDRRFDPLNYIAWMMAVGLLPFLAIAAVRTAPAVAWDLEYALLLAYSGVIATALGWMLWLALLERLSANAASFNMLAIPVIALSSSVLLLGERLAPPEWWGIVLIGAGLAVLGRLARRAGRERRAGAR